MLGGKGSTNPKGSIMPRPLVLALLLVIAPLLSTTASAEPPADVVAMVGRLVSIKELPNSCARIDASTCIYLAARYEAKYAVVDALSGSAGGPEMVFRIADHYGFPRFANYRHALLFVTHDPDGDYLQEGYAVHRTKNGSWATCGDPYNEFLGDPAQGLRSIDFADDLGIVGDFSEEGIKERFPDAKYLDISNGHIRCRRGVPVTDLYERVRTGATRGLQLPPLNR